MMPVGRYNARANMLVLLKLLQTQCKNKEKMLQHIIVIASLLTPYEKKLVKGKKTHRV
jgi:hypothetical protein